MKGSPVTAERRSGAWGHLAQAPLVWRLLAVLLVVAAMGASLQFSLSQILATVRPSLEQRIDAEGAKTAGDTSEAARAAAMLEPRPSRTAAALAREGLKKEPLNATLLRQLAFAQPAAVSSGRFKRLVDLSQAVSRRDALLQLWLVVQAAKKSDGPALMKHIDVLLRSHPGTSPLVFQSLLEGLASPQLRLILRQKITSNPPWLSDFMIFAVPSSQRPELIADVLTGFRKLPRSTDFDSAWLQLLQRLADTGHAKELRQVYLQLPQADPALLESVAIPASDAQASTAPIAWQLVENSDFSASLVSLGGSKGDAFDIYVAGGQSGVVARKVVYLSPGSYRFSATVRPETGEPNTWFSVQCLSSRSPLGQSEPQPAKAGRFSVGFDMSSGCAAAMIRIHAGSPLGRPDGSFMATNFSLTRSVARPH
jgi:hypothetical protein